MNKFYKILSAEILNSISRKSVLSRFLFTLMLVLSTTVMAQNSRVVKGRVIDEKNEPLIGATIKVKGLETNGGLTNATGQFTINVPTDKQIIVVSYIGYDTQELNILGKSNVNIILKDNTQQMSEVVVVGYGQQKKASVVGAITQTKGQVLERAGGVSSLGAALTGNLPGVVTMTTTAKPGEEDPQIIIRGVSSWNKSDPLILVDGIERQMNSVDINSVDNISVLKDASATAVYGVRGANGVILITTKRGVEGKARIDVGFSSAMKVPSSLPGKLDAYDALQVKNSVIEYELNAAPVGWTYMRSQAFINMYRNQTTQEQKERYPNINWQKLLFKDYAMSYNANINISGGTKYVKYFAAVDFQNEGDVVKYIDNGKGYNSGYQYNRLNTRANIDFQLTNSTKLAMNLSGSFGQKTAPMNVITEGYMFAAAYSTPPDLFYPKYSDGAWGYCVTNQVDGVNTMMNQANGGLGIQTTTRIATDFTLNQDLGMLLKGLSARASLSLDNSFQENSRGINNQSGDLKQKWIDPVTGITTFKNTPDGTTNVDFYQAVNWTTGGGTMNNGATYRNVNYSGQVNYAQRFGNHNVTGMGSVQRQETTNGSDIALYREDWVFRTTYNYKDKYFVEYNGAYDGSERFASQNRFGFFSSGALGWMLSEEKFMKSLTFLDMLKIRASIGQIGDDSVGRWLYMDTWNGGTTTPMTNGGTQGGASNSPYSFYTQGQIGNPSLSWETVTKKNLGVDFSIFNSLITGSVDVYNDYRTDIILAGDQRAVPSYFGFTPPKVNTGKAKVDGYEIEIKFNKKLNSDLRLWANASMTHAVDKIIDRDDPALYPAYMKKAGFSNSQVKSMISKGFYNSWDELYGSSAFDAGDAGKIPGNYRILDFDADGVVNTDKDRVAYQYPTNPQNTYNATIGVDWKGFSVFVQFYGVNNVSRYIRVMSFGNGVLPFFNNVYSEGVLWSKNNPNADSPMPRLDNASLSGMSEGTRYMYDGSYVRLKNAEVAYTFDSKGIKRLGIQALRIYVNGNNLLLWTKTPDDREVNGGTGYPTVRRINFGLKLTL